MADQDASNLPQNFSEDIEDLKLHGGARVVERFRAKWIPVRVKKTRQNKKLEPGSDPIRTGKALAERSALEMPPSPPADDPA